jgi:hypothetical protein
LTTGNRTLFSGYIVDPATGVQKAGSGEDFGNLFDIQKGKDGLHAVGTEGDPTARRPVLFKVDAATGNRTVALNLSKVDSTVNGPCSAQVGNLAVGTDGTLYSVFDTDNAPLRGVMAIEPAAGRCRIIMNTGMPLVGSGLKPVQPEFITFIDGFLWLTDRLSSALYKVNPADGVSVKVSGVKNGDPGGGLNAIGTKRLSGNSEIIWTVGSPASLGNYLGDNIISVDPQTGKRSAPNTTSDGALITSDATLVVWPHPTLKGLAVLGDKKAIKVYDPAAKMVNVVSY